MLDEKLICGCERKTGSARCGLCDKCQEHCTCREDGSFELATRVVREVIEEAFNIEEAFKTR